MRSDVFSDKAFNKKLFRITIPVSLQNLMLAAVAACDAIMLGRVDQNAMSAVSLAGQIQFVRTSSSGRPPALPPSSAPSTTGRAMRRLSQRSSACV